MVSVPRDAARGGYALLATLWICVGIGALTALISASAREAIATSRNRMALTSAMWRARACLEFGREAIDDALSDEAARADSARVVWDHVDRLLAGAPRSVAGCAITARAVGSRLDVNATDAATLSRVFQAAGWRLARADSAAAAITSWIAANGAFVNVGELDHVRGLEGVARLDSILDVEPGSLALSQAPRELLTLLPGFTDRTIQEVLDARARGMSVTSFKQLSAWLDPRAPGASARLPGLVLLTPEAWILIARARIGRPPVTAAMEVRLSRVGSAVTVTRRRSWAE
jgi:hypothetical protein